MSIDMRKLMIISPASRFVCLPRARSPLGRRYIACVSRCFVHPGLAWGAHAGQYNATTSHGRASDAGKGACSDPVHLSALMGVNPEDFFAGRASRENSDAREIPGCNCANCNRRDCDNRARTIALQ
jgi:hypothetical protein